jgi:molecular chaperone GrpE
MDNSPHDAQDVTNESEQVKQGETAGQPEQVNGGPHSAEGAETTVPAETSLETQLSEAKAKAAEYLDGWQRARADFINYKKRSEQERADAYQTAATETLRKLLPVIDDFDRALSNVPSEKADDDVIKGFNLIHRKMVTLLESSGIKVINPVGEVFNPAYHEAIGQDESSDLPSGHITVVLQKGYLHGDKVLRPALVRVAA